MGGSGETGSKGDIAKMVNHPKHPKVVLDNVILYPLGDSGRFCRVGSANYRTLVIKRILIQALPTLLQVK